MKQTHVAFKFVWIIIAVMLCAASCTPRVSPSISSTPGQAASPAENPSSAVQNNEPQSAVDFFLDTVITLTAYDISATQLKEIMARCGDYEALLSKTIPGSDVYRLNHANGQPVEVSAHMLNILQLAIEVAERAEGTLDITIGPAVDLWDFKGEPVLPDPEALQAAVAMVDYSKITINGNMVTLPAGMMLDLGAIAKGYIADEMAALCREAGVKHGILNLGGNVVVIGGKPSGEPWRIGIQHPDYPTGDYLAILPVENMSIVTSGIYERGFDLDGVRYHHILDPQTGWPAQNELASVTIISERSALADALSTACFLLERDKALALLEMYPGVEAVFLTKSLEMTATKGVADKLTLLQ